MHEPPDSHPHALRSDAALPSTSPRNALWGHLIWIAGVVPRASRAGKWLCAAAERSTHMTVCSLQRVEIEGNHRVRVLDRLRSPLRLRRALGELRRAASTADATVGFGPRPVHLALRKVIAHDGPFLCIDLNGKGEETSNTMRPVAIADTNLFVPASAHHDTTTRVISHGRAIPERRWIELCEIFALAAQGIEDLQLELVGIGPGDAAYLAELRQIRSALPATVGTRINIVASTSQQEVASRLRQADIFVDVAGGQEISRSVLEAMSTALPVLTNNAAARQLSESIPGLLPLTGVETTRQVCRNALYLQSQAEHPMSPRALDASRRHVLQEHSFAAFAERLHRATLRAEQHQSFVAARRKLQGAGRKG